LEGGVVRSNESSKRGKDNLSLSNSYPTESKEMASIRKRNGVWQARITRKGQVPVSQSFTTGLDAERWAR
jgi:hypothetical protein